MIISKFREAGRSDTVYSDDAINLIHATARGYPRAVNNLALQALVAAYTARQAIVDEKAARAAIAETRRPSIADHRHHPQENDTPPNKPHRTTPVGLFNAHP